MSSGEGIFCTGCGRECEDTALVVNGQHYHVGCLVCATCKKALDGAFCQHEGKFFCVEDYKEQFVPKCTVCHKSLEGKVLVFEGKQYHDGCYKEATPNPTFVGSDIELVPEEASKPCAGCGKVILGRVTLAMDKNWHEECFQCSKCGVKLSGNFFELNGKPVCEKDHAAFSKRRGTDYLHVGSRDGTHLPDYVDQAPTPCYSCGLDIKPGQHHLESNGKKFHNACIRCPICRLTFFIAETLVDTMIDPQTNLRVHTHCYEDEEKKRARVVSPHSSMTTAAQMANQEAKLPAPTIHTTRDMLAHDGPISYDYQSKPKSPWVATVDPESADVYYVNTVTEEVSWERPAHFDGPLLSQEGALISPVFPDGAKYDAATNTVITAAAKTASPKPTTTSPVHSNNVHAPKSNTTASPHASTTDTPNYANASILSPSHGIPMTKAQAHRDLASSPSRAPVQHAPSSNSSTSNSKVVGGTVLTSVPIVPPPAAVSIQSATASQPVQPTHSQSQETIDAAQKAAAAISVSMAAPKIDLLYTTKPSVGKPLPVPKSLRAKQDK